MNYWEEHKNRIETEEKNPKGLSINIFKIKSERKQVFDKPFARTGRIVALVTNSFALVSWWKQFKWWVKAVNWWNKLLFKWALEEKEKQISNSN